MTNAVDFTGYSSFVIEPGVFNGDQVSEEHREYEVRDCYVEKHSAGDMYKQFHIKLGFKIQ